MKGRTKIVFTVNLLLVLAVVNWMVWEKETTLRDGQLVLLALEPLDPRSLIQGDYMRLNYTMTNQWSNDKIDSRGYCIVKKSNTAVAKYERLQATRTPLAADEIAIKYYKNDYQIKIGAESFLFQEGHASNFEKARYGGLRVADNGAAVLQGLYDVSENQIIPNEVIK